MSENLKAEIVQVERAEATLAKQEQDSAQLRLRGMADELLDKNMQIMEAAAAFADIEPEDSEPPAEWVEQLGEKEARRRLRIARYACMSSKDAPVGIANARALVVGMMRSKAMEASAPKTLNVITVQMVEPKLRKALEEEFPVADVE